MRHVPEPANNHPSERSVPLLSRSVTLSKELTKKISTTSTILEDRPPHRPLSPSTPINLPLYSTRSTPLRLPSSVGQSACALSTHCHVSLSRRVLGVPQTFCHSVQTLETSISLTMQPSAGARTAIYVVALKNKAPTTQATSFHFDADLSIYSTCPP